MATDLKALVGGLFDLLEPVDSADRHKAIKAVMTMLGDQPVQLGKPERHTEDDAAPEEESGLPLPRQARDWMKRYAVTGDQLSHVFHIEGGRAEVIAHDVPGASAKQKTINAYVITGVSQLLATGESRFDDRAARDLCKRMGFFDEGNHARYIKDKGNVLGGTKDSGWTLTTPGLKAGAEMVRGLAGA